LQEFKAKVERLREHWLSHHAATFPITESREIEDIAKKIRSASKSSKTLLVVKFPDGTLIYENFAADSFAKTLKKLGFDAVAALGIKVNREELVSRKRPTSYNNFKEIDGYFVITHSSTEQKREILEKVSGLRGIILSINIVPGNHTDGG